MFDMISRISSVHWELGVQVSSSSWPAAGKEKQLDCMDCITILTLLISPVFVGFWVWCFHRRWTGLGPQRKMDIMWRGNIKARGDSEGIKKVWLALVGWGE
jgi:hypothetical protein